MIAALIIAIVAVVVGISTSAAAKGVKDRELKKASLWKLLYEPVYVNGLSFEAVKTGYLSDYRKNPDLFKRYYDEYMVMREADLEYGNHPLSEKKKDYLYRRYILIGLLICLIFVIYIANNE
jgi:uncharacterized integral membrane protein